MPSRYIEGQAGNVAQRLAQRIRFLFFHQRTGNGRNRLRNIVRILHHLADTGLAGTIAVRLLGRRLDRHRRQGRLFGGSNFGRAEQAGHDSRCPQRQQTDISPGTERRWGNAAHLNTRIFFLAVFHKQSYSSQRDGWLA
jgi:hypothetical protein